MEFSRLLPPGVPEHQIIFVFRHCLVLLNVCYFNVILNDSIKIDPSHVGSVLSKSNGPLGRWDLDDFYMLKGASG